MFGLLIGTVATAKGPIAQVPGVSPLRTTRREVSWTSVCMSARSKNTPHVEQIHTPPWTKMHVKEKQATALQKPSTELLQFLVHHCHAEVTFQVIFSWGNDHSNGKTT